jgi:putative alpha-1,2-mannosidase
LLLAAASYLGLAGSEPHLSDYIQPLVGTRVCPASDYYVFGSPAVSRAVVHLSNGKKFTMTAKNLSDQNIYVQSVNLNGKGWNNPFLPWRELKRGGSLIFAMGPEPNRQWATQATPPD